MLFVLHQKTDGNCCFTKLLQVRSEGNSKLVGPSFSKLKNSCHLKMQNAFDFLDDY